MIVEEREITAQFPFRVLQVAAEDANAPGRGRTPSGRASEEGGLARAVSAKQRDDVAGL